MGTFRIWTVALVASVLGSLNAFGLEWATTRISVDAAPEQESLEGVFAFTNNSEKTVTINSVRSSCGCTVPELTKHEYAPGADTFTFDSPKITPPRRASRSKVDLRWERVTMAGGKNLRKPEEKSKGFASGR